MRPRATPVASTVLLEISPRVAKLVTATGAPPQLERVQAVVLPESTEESDILAALKALLASQAVPARQVGVLFGRETFSLRTLELPSVDPKELASMLDLQLGKLTPYPRAEILSGWALLGSFREGYTSVLLAIGRKTIIDEVLRFLKTKGMVPQWVGVSTEGLEAWWGLAGRLDPPAPSGALAALIDIDATSTDCAMFSGGQLVFSHSIAIGAEQLKSSQPAVLRWVGELVRLPRILSHESIKGTIGRGVVTGLTQELQPLIEQLEGQWGAPLKTAEALGVSPVSAAVRQQAAGSGVSYAALAGVLVSGKSPRIDLLPLETRVSQALDVRAKHLTRLAINAAVILVLAAGLYLERIIMLRYHLTQLQEQLSSLERTSRDIIARKEAMQQIRAWLEPSRSALEALATVESAAGPGMTVTHFSFTEQGAVKIRGTAEAVRTPYEFVDRLKQQPSAGIGATCYVSNAKAGGARAAEFEVACGASDS